MTKEDYTRIANVINGATILIPYNGLISDSVTRKFSSQDRRIRLSILVA